MRRFTRRLLWLIPSAVVITLKLTPRRGWKFIAVATLRSCAAAFTLTTIDPRQ